MQYRAVRFILTALLVLFFELLLCRTQSCCSRSYEGNL